MIARTQTWCLNNFLLESPGLKGQVEREIKSFFVENSDTTPTGVVWDIFNAYIHRIFTSF